jgi:uncharacterized protein DUF6894
MALFYFDVQVDGTLVKDKDGLDLADLAAAKVQAKETCMAIGCDEFPATGGNGDVVIEVRNEHHDLVLTVTATMSLKVDSMRQI